MIARQRGHAACSLGRRDGAVQIAQLHPGHGLRCPGAGAQLVAECRGPLQAPKFPERVAQPSLGGERAREQEPCRRLHRRVGIAVEQGTAGRLGVGELP